MKSNDVSSELLELFRIGGNAVINRVCVPVRYCIERCVPQDFRFKVEDRIRFHVGDRVLAVAQDRVKDVWKHFQRTRLP